MTTVIVDNFDSFSWNLYQLFGALGGAPVVVRNDVSLDAVQALAPARIVLSPGPGRPDDPTRIGVCQAILAELDVPILGVCLGHQAIACAAGARVIPARAPVHGKTSEIEHTGAGILRDLPRPFAAMRYHSLVVDPASLPDTLTLTAWCKDGTVMGVRHTRRPIFGVQFHPESIGTDAGAILCQSFLRGDYP
jgi:anthranilate synthase/aminodeoxychorismate synthase-like glutamine amidotransferase